MPSRRTLLLTAMAASLAPPGFADPSPARASLDALLEAFAGEDLDRSPETVTGLGLDVGARAAAKSKLDDYSLAGRAQDHADTSSQLKRLRAVDRRALGGEDAVNYDTVEFLLDTQARADQAFAYADGPSTPYALSQLSGAYQSVPDFLAGQHTIETREDAEAYLARLEAFAGAMDQELAKARHDVGLGAVPPDFALDKAVRLTGALRDQPAGATGLVQSLVSRAKDKAIAGGWEARAGRIYDQQVQPALDRQEAFLRDVRERAHHDAGVWRLPDGEAYYAASLASSTTTTMTPAEVHKTGVDLVVSLSAELDTRLKAEGYSQGFVGLRLRALFADPKYRYPNDAAGRAQLLADLNAKVKVVQAKLPAWFNTLPKTPVEIRRVPVSTEAAAAQGYYEAGSLDGMRPGYYYVNLRDTAELPRWSLPTLTYHEAIPGHHLQLSLQQEADLPLIRKMAWFDAYGEGWALYAEELAEEMGLYDGDPLGRIGYLHDALFRAVRLVVDTGMHQLRWSRERALQFYVEALGDPESAAATEIERYAVWPGQACSYMVGKLTWLRLRERARAVLGARFDIRAFHDAGLLPGAMPLTVLDRVIADYART